MIYIITFPSTYQALNFEKKYKDAEYSLTLRPVPREISSSCGIAAQIKCNKEDVIQILQGCKQNNILTDSLYSYEKINNKQKVIKII